MRLLIIGGNGMLGHQLLRSWSGRHDVRVTLRGPLERYAEHGLFNEHNAVGGVDVLDDQRIDRLILEERPDAVINAAGVIKQRDGVKDAVGCLSVNGCFPRRLNDLCRRHGARLVHVSTDCVFDGMRGGYTESDPANATDVYGLSKYLGEVTESPGVTLRTSIIGLELDQKRSLIEWFLAQREAVCGFTRAIYTGVTTIELARVIERVLAEQPELSGLWQVASSPISKFDLLTAFAAELGRDDIEIAPDAEFFCDRSLDGSAFAERTGYRAPAWSTMLRELAQQTKERESCRDAA
ncbi:MAG: SDR family oxidoreductase [Planctomycetota bacterium]